MVVYDLSPGADIDVEFGLPPNSSPVTLSLAQLEPGTRPTVFERRDDELERCRRYFRRLVEPRLRGVVQAANIAGRCGMPLSPPMRSIPRVSLTGTPHILDGTIGTAVAAIAANYSTADCLELDLQLMSPLTSGRPAILYVAGQDGMIDVNAEL